MTQEFLDPIPALTITQSKATFYVFAISAKKLFEIAYTSDRTRYNQTETQRVLRPDRLKEIDKFLTSNGSNTPLLPNAIIVSLSPKVISETDVFTSVSVLPVKLLSLTDNIVFGRSSRNTQET